VVLPGDITTITVTGSFETTLGVPATGNVLFTPFSTLTDTFGEVILTEAPAVAALAGGAFSIVLPCTDNENIRPTPFEYLVQVAVPYATQDPFAVAIPSTLGSTVDLSALYPIPTPARPVNGLYVISVNGQSGSAQVAPYNLPGTGAATRYAGATTSGHPVSGTFAAGDFVVDQTGLFWICTVPGTPGTWVEAGGGGSGGGSVTSVFSRTGAVTAQSGDYAVGQVTGAAPLASPALTGAPTAPTAGNGDSTTKVATTAFVQTAVEGGSGAVASVFTRTGAVTAQSGDYTVTQVTGAAPSASPALTGTPTAPTATALTDSTVLATTAYADSAVAAETGRAETAEALKAPLASPALTGTPTAPTQATGDNTTKLATDAFVGTAVAVETTRAEAAEALLAPKASPALTGTPTAPTATALTDSTQLATTAYADTAVAAETTRAETAEALAMPRTGGAWTGAISPAVVTLTDGATISLNASAGNYFQVTLGGNRAMASPTSPANGQTIVIEIIQDATGSRTLSWGGAYSFPASIPQPTLSTTPADRDAVTFQYDASITTWACRGFVSAQAASLSLPVPVTQGGTGLTALTAFELLAGGTTGGGVVQPIPIGSSTQVLTSNGPGALPSFQAAATGFTNPMTTLGDLIYENVTPAAARLAGSTSTTKQFLTQTGTGAVSAAPAWAGVLAADLPAATTSAQGAVILDGTATDILAAGNQAAGAKGQAADARHVHAENSPWIPADNNLLAATDSLAAVDATVQPAAGTLYLVKVPVRAPATFSNIWTVIGTAGVGTSTGSFIGLYSSAGTLLTGSADIGTLLTTGFVSRELPVTTPQAVTAGTFVWVGFVINMPTMPFLRQLNNGTVVANVGLTAASYRFCTAGTGLTALPGSITPASNTAPTISPFWFGVA
jgi:hypothetical protein